jgi:hypothetical protein
MVLEWRIYYDGLPPFDSSQGAPEDAPSMGVQAIVFPNTKLGRKVLQEFDYYLYLDPPGVWIGVWGHDALVDQVAHKSPVIRTVKVGRMLPREEFEKIVNQALDDSDFPHKTSSGTDERPDLR